VAATEQVVVDAEIDLGRVVAHGVRTTLFGRLRGKGEGSGQQAGQPKDCDTIPAPARVTNCVRWTMLFSEQTSDPDALVPARGREYRGVAENDRKPSPSP